MKRKIAEILDFNLYSIYGGVSYNFTVLAEEKSNL